MALEPCPECGKPVSTFASACPQCGYPVALYRKVLLRAAVFLATTCSAAMVAAVLIYLAIHTAQPV